MKLLLDTHVVLWWQRDDRRLNTAARRAIAQADIVWVSAVSRITEFARDFWRLTPNEFASLAALEHDLLAFQARCQAIATPFRWTFTRADLHQLLARLAASADAVRPAA